MSRLEPTKPVLFEPTSSSTSRGAWARRCSAGVLGLLLVAGAACKPTDAPNDSPAVSQGVVEESATTAAPTLEPDEVVTQPARSEPEFVAQATPEVEEEAKLPVATEKPKCGAGTTNTTLKCAQTPPNEDQDRSANHILTTDF